MVDGVIYLEKLPDIIITNIHKKYTGITTTIINLYPEHAKEFNIGLYVNLFRFTHRSIDTHMNLRRFYMKKYIGLYVNFNRLVYKFI